MAGRHDDLQIIIKRNGEVWVEGSNMPARRLLHYRRLLEEILGPTRLAAGEGEIPPPPQAQSETAAQQSLESGSELSRRQKLGG
ncbi:MAG: hypothetical protein Kow0059_14740 [Candidatus Sumerlaeia bacterium]